jgi:hypothetical protein
LIFILDLDSTNMAGRGRGLNLFKQLKDESDDESQLDDSASVRAPTESSFAAARGPMPYPRNIPGFLETETDDTASEVAPSSVAFVLPTRGRGIFSISTQKSSTASKGSDDSSQVDQAPSTITNFFMGRGGRGVALPSSGE